MEQMNIKIDIVTLRREGKLLGGCVYVGFPLMEFIKISVSENVFVVQEIDMYITEELDYAFIIRDLDGRDIEMSSDQFSKKIEKEEHNFDDEDGELFGIGYDEDYFTKPYKETFAIGTLQFYTSDKDKPMIKDFIKRYIQVLRKIQKDAESLMISCKEIINPRNGKTGFYQ